MTSPQIASALANMTQAAKVDALARLDKRALAELFELGAAQPRLELADLVPPGAPALTEVIHEGKNSLPLFTRFQKRFCRPPRTIGDELWGYNEQRFGWATGPGYFIAHHAEDGELVIDYRRLPDMSTAAGPPGWPRSIPNSSRLGRFVYHGMVDVLRRVAPSVTVGRAYRRGAPLDVWFGLVSTSRSADLSAAGGGMG